MRNLNAILGITQWILNNQALAIVSNAQTTVLEPVLGTNVVVPSSELVPLESVDVSFFDTLGVQVKNTGANPLMAFAIQVKFSPGGDWITVFDEAADFTAPPFGSPLDGASSDLTTLGADEEGWFNLNVNFYARLRLMAGSSSGTTLSASAVGKSRVKFQSAFG